ncbi:MAG: AAA family ATPase [Dehalococcoidia bacterium]|nr:AAA family ATPase [Dehalococcoidia bacterium]
MSALQSSLWPEPGRPADQRERDLAIGEFSTPVCVEAAAGTGKTSLMVDRVVAIVSRGEARITEIVAITFTEAAAAELRVRIRARLEEALAAGGSEDERRRVEEALVDLDRAHVETIHAFAQSLLRERPVEARIDPRFELLDELAMKVDFEAAWEEWFATALEADSTAVERALLLGFPFSGIKNLAARINEQRDLLPLNHSPVPRPDIDAYRQELAGGVARLQEMQAHCRDHGDLGYRQIDEAADYLLRLQMADREQAQRIVAGHRDVLKNKGNKLKWEADYCARQKEVFGELTVARDRVRNELCSGALVLLMQWLEGFPSWYEKRRRDSGKLDFDDLLVLARRLLKERVEVRRYFQRRFKHILVDEFQDTDPLQVEIVFFLAEREGSTPAADWTEVELATDKLFVVGDPKQSIYRFRRADIAIYENARQIIERGGRRLLISQNFRCRPGIVDWANGTFAAQMTGAPGVQADYIPLIASETRDIALGGEGDGVTALRPTTTPDKEERADGMRRQEAEHIAALIQQKIVGNWQVQDPDDRETRPARASDIAILMPTRTGLHIYEAVFRDQGLTYRHEGGSFFYVRQEIKDAIALLLAIDNPLDSITVAATLRHVFGVSDEDLLAHRVAGGSFDYTAVTPAEAPTSITDAYRVLARLHQVRNDMRLSALVEEALRESRLTELHTLRRQGRQAVANLRKLAQMSRQYEAQTAATLHRFTRWLRTNRDGAAREGDAPAHVPNSPGTEVNLYTIHAAKGLEFPIVILANLGGSLNNPSREYADRVGKELHVRRGSSGKAEFATPRFAEIAPHEEARDDAERVRQLYVAATRARDHLVVGAFRSGKVERCWLGYLGKGLDDVPGIDRSGLQQVQPPAVAPIPSDADAAARLVAGRAAWEQRRAELLTAMPHRSIWTATSLVRFDGGAEPLSRTPASSAIRLGSALHAALERVDLRHWDDRGLDALVEAVAADYEVEDRRPELSAMLRSTLRSPLMERALRSAQVWREVPFAFPFDGGLVEGAMDLLFREDAGLVLVDVKSDNVAAADTEARAQRYAPQAMVYALACEQVTGLPIAEFLFHFARPGVGVSLAGPGLADGGRELLTRAPGQALAVEPGS